MLFGHLMIAIAAVTSTVLATHVNVSTPHHDQHTITASNGLVRRADTTTTPPKKKCKNTVSKCKKVRMKTQTESLPTTKDTVKQATWTSWLSQYLWPSAPVAGGGGDGSISSADVVSGNGNGGGRRKKRKCKDVVAVVDVSIPVDAPAPYMPELPKVDPKPESPKVQPKPEAPKVQPKPASPKVQPKPATPKAQPKPAVQQKPPPASSCPKKPYRTSSAWSLPDFSNRDLSGFKKYKNNYGVENRAFVPDPAGSDDTVLRVRYPPGTYTPAKGMKKGYVGGTGFYASPLDLSAARTVTMRYQVYFPRGFNFVKGGKLPGLYGGSENCSGGTRANSCFSTRFMFRDRGIGELYSYMDKRKMTSSFCRSSANTICNPWYGVSIGRGSWVFSTGEWHTLEQTVRLNSLGQTDGLVVVKHNNREVVRLDHVAWRARDFRIAGIDFATFFGGRDASWATPKNQFTYFKGFSMRVDEWL